MSAMARMRHPEVPQEIEVYPAAVPHHQAAGWQPVEDEAASSQAPAFGPEGSESQADSATEGASIPSNPKPPESATRRRRAASKESE